MANDVVPYLNVAAKWDGAPDQGLLQEKGGRGFPYCALMNADGEVVWEERPSEREAWDEALSQAQRLHELRISAEADPDNAALAANVALLDAMGRDQRPKPELEELDRAAETEGVAEDIVAMYRPWRTTEEFMRSIYAQSEDNGASAFALFLAGKKPTGESDGLVFSFYRAALEGAIAAEDAPRAFELLELWIGAATDPDFAEWTAQQVQKYRARIEEIGG